MTRREKMPTALPQVMAARMQELIRERATLPREDLEYVVETIAKLKDERLKACIAELIGWGDEERAEIETFIAVALEVLKKTNPSKLREATLVVETRFLIKEMK